MTTTLDVVEVSRRDRKKRATRQDLSLAALNLVLDKGVAGFTVEDIAQAADVSTRTFFNYFPSKESAIIGYNPERLERLRTILLARPAEESPFLAFRAALIDQITEMAKEVSVFGEGRVTWLCRMHTVKSDPHLYAAYVANMAIFEQDCVAALCQRMGVDPEEDQAPALLVGTLLAAGRVAMMSWVSGGGHESAPALTAAALDALGDGFARAMPEMKVPKGHMRRTKQMVLNYTRAKKAQ